MDSIYASKQNKAFFPLDFQELKMLVFISLFIRLVTDQDLKKIQTTRRNHDQAL